MNTGIYMIANSAVLKNTKTYLDSKYKTVVMYGASTVDGVKEIYKDINNMNLKAIVYVDSVYTDEEVKTTFDIIKDIIVHVDSSISIFFIGPQNRANIAKLVISEIEKTNDNITCNFYETYKKYTTRLLEEGVLYSLLTSNEEKPNENKELHLESRTPLQPTIDKPFDINNIEAISLDNSKYDVDDNRHIYLMKNIEQMIAYNNKPKDSITDSLIKDIMSGKITDIANVKDVIDNETDSDEVGNEIKVALTSLENDIEKIENLLKKDPNNESLKLTLIKLNSYYKNIKLNKARYQYTTYTRVMKETSNVITKEYENKIKELEVTTDKYSSSIDKMKKFTEDDKITEKNKEKIKKKIKMLKDYKADIENNLNTYISSIDLIYNGMNKSYIEAMTDVRKLISETRDDITTLPTLQGKVGNSVLNGITSSKITAIEQLHADGKEILALKQETFNNLKTLFIHTDNINIGLKRLVSVLELIVIEQDRYINYIEAQSRKRIVTYNSIQEDIIKKEIADKVFAVLGVSTVGKTGFTLSSAYALSKCNNKKVLVIDLVYNSPQAMYYTENEPFSQDLLTLVNNNSYSVNSMFENCNFKVLTLDTLDSDRDVDICLNAVPELIKQATSVVDHIFVLLPNNLDKVKPIMELSTRLILITDLDVSHYRGTSRIVDAINSYEDERINSGKNTIYVKYFIVNKCIGKTDLELVASKCSVDSTEYTLRQFNNLDMIMISKSEGVLKIKESNTLLNNTNWIGAELYD